MTSRTKYRIQPAYGDHWTFERCDGRVTTNGGGDYWKVIDICDNREVAEKRLAKAEAKLEGPAMIRVTLTIDLPEWWGADQFYAEGGESAVKEMALEDLHAFVEEAKWKIENLDSK